MAKLISIVTVNLNNASGLKKTIESVIRQSSRNFDLIIIDGASTDGSKEIIENYRSNLAYSVSEPDKGVYHAMNKGIAVATGKYLLFLNSGDCLAHTEVLQEFERQKADTNHGIYYGDANYVSETGAYVRHYPNVLSFSFFLKHNLSHQASLIKRELFNDFFLYNEEYRIVSDWEFFVYAICKRNVSYQHLDIIICDYDTTGVSSVISNHKQMHEERELTIKKFFPLFIEDYKKIEEVGSKRFLQFLHIKRYPLAFKVLKGLMSVLLLLLPKPQKRNPF